MLITDLEPILRLALDDSFTAIWEVNRMGDARHFHKAHKLSGSIETRPATYVEYLELRLIHDASVFCFLGELTQV